MKSNSRHLFLHRNSTIVSCSQRLGYKQVGPSGLAELEQLHVESNGECNRHVYLSSTLANSHLARDLSSLVPVSGLGTKLEIYHIRKHVARLRMWPRCAREAIVQIRIPSIIIPKHSVVTHSGSSAWDQCH